MLPSTSGGHDPISAARGRDRCFLPGLALDWGRCAKAAHGEGEPPNRGSPVHSQQQGQSPVPPRNQGQPHPLAHTRSGSDSHAADRVGAWGKGLDVPTPDQGWSREVGKVQAANTAGNPLPHTHHPSPCQSSLSPVQPNRGASAPPRPSVPLGLPPGGRLPRWSPAAGSPATAPGRSARGRGYIGGGATAAGARLALEVAAAPLPEQNVARTRPTLQAVRSSQPGLRRGNKWTCSPDQLGGLEQGPWCLAPLDVRHVLGYRAYFCLEHLLSADHAHTHLF